MLRQVVADGTGLNAQIPGYSVAGKTGTTQKVDPKTHSYCGGDGHCEYDASFVGFVPAKNPRAVVLVVVDEPQGDYYGGEVAARRSARSPPASCRLRRPAGRTVAPAEGAHVGRAAPGECRSGAGPHRPARPYRTVYAIRRRAHPAGPPLANHPRLNSRVLLVRR